MADHQNSDPGGKPETNLLPIITQTDMEMEDEICWHKEELKEQDCACIDNVSEVMKDTLKRLALLRLVANLDTENNSPNATESKPDNLAAISAKLTELTQRINTLESGQNVQDTSTLDPVTIATPMATPRATWANVAAKSPPLPKTSSTPTKDQDTTAPDTTGPAATTDPRCLIIQKINDLLEKKNIPHYLRVMAIGYSIAGNIKVTTAPTCKASDLIAFSHKIAATITQNEVISVLPDLEHYRIKINKIPTYGNNELITPGMVHEELATYVPQYKSLRYWRLPKWLGTDETICTKNFVSIIIDLSNKKDRDTLLSLKTVYLFNTKCSITPYEDRIQIHACSK
ncbi:uncharacterized protein EI90DRAFT_3032776, partial [Cantharellus anzutake]|uniref:uncharacterized protein n=1 Tax=Cantharellus anzutake TaxID=1750568 RepID=UPI001908CEC8